jgi:hypothetical protein
LPADAWTAKMIITARAAIAFNPRELLAFNIRWFLLFAGFICL